MGQTFTCILLLLSLSATFGKYVYIKERKTWHEAQRYCQMFHTDLAPVTNEHDKQQLWQLTGKGDDSVWIGLVRNFTDREKWTWSGGGDVSTFFWEDGQPNNRQNEDYGLTSHKQWHDATPDFEETFVCYSAVVVRERKTWEEALKYCREHHHDLASVVSDTEMLLIRKELEKNEITRHVWIGLHFFPGQWLWVDGQPLSYEAWGQEGGPECPELKLACAALQVTGGTQRSNGTDSALVTNPTLGAVEDHVNTAVHTAVHNTLNSSGASDMAAGVKELVWEAHDCEERLHFICY